MTDDAKQEREAVLLPSQTNALEFEIKRLREIVYLYVDPFDVTPEDEDFVQAAQRAALKESK